MIRKTKKLRHCEVASNGSGPYRFMLYASDGQLNGAAQPDKLRIKIWSENTDGTESVIYDNKTETALGGGSIVVHK